MQSKNTMNPNNVPGESLDSINSSNVKINIRYIYLFIFILATFLRFYIASANTQANDNHFEVINKISQTGELPGKKSCWQCYHAKFYHLTAHGLLTIFQIKDSIERLHFAQYINVVFGMLTILLFFRLLKYMAYNEWIKLIVFAIIALNPSMLGINTQCTNDTFAIFFSSLAIYATFRLITNAPQYKKYFFWITIGLIGSVGSKGSGLAVWIAINCVLLGLLFTGNSWYSRKRLFFISFIINILVLSAVAPLGYYQNLRDHGSPFVINIGPSKPLKFYKQNFNNTGATSIVHSYMNFHYTDLIKHPYINSSKKDYPINRNSLWSQLYGRFMSLRFERYPGSWRTTELLPRSLGRWAMVFGLIPFLILVTGFIYTNITFFKEFSWKKRRLPHVKFLNLMVGYGLLGIVIKLSATYTSLSSMKVIYVLPAFFAYLYFLLEGLKFIASLKLIRKIRMPSFSSTMITIVFILCWVHVLEGFSLAHDLHGNYAKNVQAEAKASRHDHLVHSDSARVLLTDLIPFRKEGSYNLNKDFNNRYPIQVGAKLFNNGIGTHAPSTLHYKLNKQYLLFETRVGISDHVSTHDGIRVNIWVDGKLKFRSIILYAGELHAISVDVENANFLMLEAQEVGNKNSDHVNWLNPILYKKSIDHSK